METKLDEILDGLPTKSPRSRLESYGDFIRELRRRKRTYREIAQILEEKCQLRVSKSTVHRFVQLMSRWKKPPQSPVVTPIKKTPTEIDVPVVATSTQAMDEVRRHIEELKKRSIPEGTSDKEFKYDRDEPLHLVPNFERKKSDDA